MINDELKISTAAPVVLKMGKGRGREGARGAQLPRSIDVFEAET